MLHDKTNGIATLAATEAFVNFFAGRNCKRRCFFIVEGAVANVVGPSSFKFHKGSNDIINIDSALYLLYGFF
ncbi:MAG: hypothetical protein RI991_1059 [Bacteroidota bacterium]